MICLETRHFNVNRILLLAVGLWPYQRSRIVELQLILFFGILTTFIIFQFTTFLTSKCTPEHIIKIISTTFFFTYYVIKYNSFWINADTIRSLLDRLQDVCNELRDETEIAILKKYGSKAKRYTTAIILLGIYSVGITTAVCIWTYIQYIGLPKNESRLNPSEYFITEYFFDQEKYSYLITLHGLATIYIGSVTLTATGTMLLAYLQHICGMFSIASYRIEQAINILQKDILKSENMVYKKITYAVDIHRKAMEFTDFLISNFEGSFFLLMVIGVTCISFNLFWLASYNDEIEKLVAPFLMINIIYAYLFLANYTAQEITDHNEYVFATVYNVQWYTAPLHIQKIILFLLQRGIKPFHINYSGIFVASLENAATLFSTSIYYFTVLCSTREN
ncbi:odorant receptor 49b-like isoform X2 [Temnothorax longispinosus]|uniref:odorant receptor 49b-like isoform X2 n=1 Tax=Temnothorax longispinosus TaxID=300112 RepID=UPI003A99F70A